MTDTPASMTYGGYLGLDALLSAQHPISDHHDEMLFVILHQTKELWLKQIIHELHLSLRLIREDSLAPVHKSLSRVSRIQAVMTLSWDVLATMTPSDYTSFRHVLGASSGLQSAQFRQFEYMLGLKDGGFLRFQEEGSGPYAALLEALHARSLWDEANAALARAGFATGSDDEIAASWLDVYRHADDYFGLYQLAEKLVDIDDSLAAWRHKHVLTVERIIGRKRGTGGSAGVDYLLSTISKRAFPQLWSLRTLL
jgi:tryptophan 2,3-dioxygenase